MQVAGFLYDGESWSDEVECVHPMLRETGIIVNDALSPAGLRRLSLLAARISGSGTFVAEWSEAERVALSVALARWCTEFAETVTGAVKFAAFAAKTAIGAATFAAFAAKIAGAAAGAAEYDGVLIDFYTALVDEFDRLAGRASHDLTPAQGEVIRQLIGHH